MKNLMLGLMLGLIVSGCESLPPGKAPDGAIVDPVKAEVGAMEEETAVNYMITSISMRCAPVANSGGVSPLTGMKFNNSEDLRAKLLPSKVFSELLKISLVKYDHDKKPEYYLISDLTKEANKEDKTDNSIWTLKFISADGKKEFWQEKLVLKKETVK